MSRHEVEPNPDKKEIGEGSASSLAIGALVFVIDIIDFGNYTELKRFIYTFIIPGATLILNHYIKKIFSLLKRHERQKIDLALEATSKKLLESNEIPEDKKGYIKNEIQEMKIQDFTDLVQKRKKIKSQEIDNI